MEFLDLNKKPDLSDSRELLKRVKDGAVKNNGSVTLRGYIHKIREMSGFDFIIIRTGTDLIQCVLDTAEGKPELCEEMCVEIAGTIVFDERSRMGFEIRIGSVKVLSKPAELSPLNINKKKLDCGLDIALDYRPLSMRNPDERNVFRITDDVLYAFKHFMRSDGFIEFVPPKIVAAGAEGGADMFDLDYFGQRAYLNQSPQAYKQMMVGVFNKVYAISPVFRAEKHGTSRHINEFTGLDIERGFIDSFYDVIDVEARFMQYLYNFLRENSAETLEELKVSLPIIDRIPHVKFADIKQIVADKYKRNFRNKFDMEPEEERLIGKYFQDEFNSPFVFVTHYPSKKRPFYAMDDPADISYTLSFDLLLNGAEVTTGGQRIHDYYAQVEKMQARGMDIEQFSDYLMMHKYGMPPHGGLGLGLERLVMKILDLDNIRKSTAFPRDIARLRP